MCVSAIEVERVFCVYRVNNLFFYFFKLIIIKMFDQIACKHLF